MITHRGEMELGVKGIMRCIIAYDHIDGAQSSHLLRILPLTVLFTNTSACMLSIPYRPLQLFYMESTKRLLLGPEDIVRTCIH